MWFLSFIYIKLKQLCMNIPKVMCGIWFAQCGDNVWLSDQPWETMSHRGPDNTKVYMHDGSVFVFHRLAINDIKDSGNQPFVQEETALVCNGEIYNCEELRRIAGTEGGSDCEVIFSMLHINMNLVELVSSLDGVFAFVAKHNGIVIAARDPIGVRPLYYGYDCKGGVCFSSEMKGLQGVCEKIIEFPPGHVFSSMDSSVLGVNEGFTKYAQFALKPTTPYCSTTLNSLLHASVTKRLMSDRPIGFFLSGGLDSSLIASIGAGVLGKIDTFSIGIGESPDVQAARVVAKHISSNHHEYTFTTNEAIEALRNVIWHLESYDCTTIRASVPMFILSRNIARDTDIRVLLSGEGADELFGGYLYMHNAPTPELFNEETIRLLDNVHAHDVLRADRCTSAHGLELRVPFFDRSVLNYITSVSAKLKMPHKNTEKYLLRSAFDQSGLLPEEILWRQKNGMSDAVGYSWVTFMRDYAERQFSNEEFRTYAARYTRNQPKTKEELLYRRIYTDMFGAHDNVPHIWRPAWTDEVDPSAARLPQHVR